jgi:hypothetical protein
MKRTKYNIGMKTHRHEISQVNISGNYELEGTIRDYEVTRNPNEYTSYHHGTAAEPTDRIQAEINFSVKNMNFSSGDSTYNNEVDAENYPDYVKIPVLMYIGEPVQ